VRHDHPGAPPQHRHRHAQVNQAHHALVGIARHSPMIAKEFIITKEIRAYSVNFFRQDKSLRANGDCTALPDVDPASRECLCITSPLANGIAA
jgi:hypothetical protein